MNSQGVKDLSFIHAITFSSNSVRETGNGDPTAGGGGGGGVQAMKKGISANMAAFFLIAQMAGAGFLALPRALADVGTQRELKE